MRARNRLLTESSPQFNNRRKMIYLYLILKLAVLHPVVVIPCLMLITIIIIALTLQAGMKPVKLEESHFKTRQCHQRVVSLTTCHHTPRSVFRRSRKPGRGL
jgi:hypothetical protein